MNATPAPAPAAPHWPHCGYGADPVTDPVGCTGIHVHGRTACLAHLNDTERDAYLAALTPGSDVDHRGTPFSEPLLQALLHALHDPTTGEPAVGAADFSGARFSGNADFSGAQFSGEARFPGAWFSAPVNFNEAHFSSTADFSGAQFSGEARFPGAWFSAPVDFNEAHFSSTADFTGARFTSTADTDIHAALFTPAANFGKARFSGDARFSWARFSSTAWFVMAQFTSEANFDHAQFSGNADFSEATFDDTARFSAARLYHARFGGARFSGDALFRLARFSGDAQFSGARFSSTAWFVMAQFTSDAAFDGAHFTGASEIGPVVCAGTVNLSRAVFEVPVTLDIAAREVRCERARWESTATFRLRHATMDLSHAVLSFPLAVTAHPAPFTTSLGVAVGEGSLEGSDSGVRVVSVRGVDAAHLVLTDTDLTDCLFSGAFHLDQLRLEGLCTFASTPDGFRRHPRSIWPYRWTRRRTLAEEHHWRAQASGQTAPPTGQAPSRREWRTGPHHPDPGLTPDPGDVAALYRQLRKAFEDGKNEPGAADFYYGECEMRRHDRANTPWSERGLLWGYWLLSGYGLRASRALGWLALAMITTILLMMGLGLPNDSPKQEVVREQVDSRWKTVIDKPEPQNPTGDRFTSERFEKALKVTLNSVVFRSSGQDLTTWGTYTEMASRFTEPVLLGLAALAIRSRIKR
jgi:uncharacterized protein YjbI with pentapeptide repeats